MTPDRPSDLIAIQDSLQNFDICSPRLAQDIWDIFYALDEDVDFLTKKEYNQVANIVKAMDALIENINALPNNLVTNEFGDELSNLIDVLHHLSERLSDEYKETKRDQRRPTSEDGIQNLQICDLLRSQGINSKWECAKIIATIRENTGRSAMPFENLRNTIHQQLRNASLK